MSRFLFVAMLMLFLLPPSVGQAIETAPPISDRETIERLTRLEERQKALQQGQEALRQEMQQFRQDVNTQIQQLRTDMDAQFSYVFQLMVGMLGAFASIVAVTIIFALWDRRTMVRPFESKVKAIEEELVQDRQRFHALIEALRALSVNDHRLADVLRNLISYNPLGGSNVTHPFCLTADCSRSARQSCRLPTRLDSSRHCQ